MIWLVRLMFDSLINLYLSPPVTPTLELSTSTERPITLLLSAGPLPSRPLPLSRPLPSLPSTIPSLPRLLSPTLLSSTLPPSLATTLAPPAKRLIDLDANSAADVLAAVPGASDATRNLSTGIPVYVNSLGIPTANAFFTLFFTWLFLWAVFLALHALLYIVLLLLTKSRERTTWSGEKRVEPRKGWLYRLRQNYGRFFLTNVLRMVSVSLDQPSQLFRVRS
jgi:hypothetical protein